MLNSSFKVCGISVRTTNKAEMGSNAKLGQLWNRFFAENILQKIPQRVGDELYAVYCNYESDFNGEYDCLVGVKTELSEPIDGLTSIEVPAGNYLKLKTERGPVFQVVGGLWQKIWSMSPSEIGGIRSYIADYEVYGAEAANPNDARVEILIGYK